MGFVYERKINYYETDKMGITHHSNYIRYMEEARIAWLDSIGFGYKKMEELGVISPVVEVNSRFARISTFDDVLLITVNLVKYTGTQFLIEYSMVNKETSQLICKSSSLHCFVNENGRPIRIGATYPEIDNLLKDMLVTDGE